MKLLTAIAATLISLAPSVALALPVSPLKFTPGSECAAVYSKDHGRLYSINVRKGQTIAVTTDNMEVMQLLVKNPNGVFSDMPQVSEGKAFVWQANFSGSYTLYFYAGDSDFHTPEALVVCVI